jgi:hypothetical protein
VIENASTSQPPLWPSVGALLIAGWAGGIVASILWAPLLGASTLGSALSSPGALTASWLAPTLAGALVASAVLPRLLPAFCEFELGFRSAFVITLGRSLAGFAASAVISAMLVTRGAPVSSSATRFLLPEIVSLAVGYQLLKRLARPVRRLVEPSFAGPSWLEREPATVAQMTDWGHLLAGARAEIAQTLGILARAEPTDVPGLVAEALTRLATLAERVERVPPPNPAARGPQLELVAGIRNLQGALVDLAESAWRGDHRHEVSRLHGLDEIEHALGQLDSVR